MTVPLWSSGYQATLDPKFGLVIGASKGQRGYPQRSWPRRIKVDRRIYDVRNEWEIRQILDRLEREQREKLRLEESKPLTPTRAKTIRLIKSKITRAENRLREVNDDIRQQEEELILMVMNLDG